MEVICDIELLSHGKVNNDCAVIAVVDEFKQDSCVNSSLNLDSEENESMIFKNKLVKYHEALEKKIHNDIDGKTPCNNINDSLLLDCKENDSVLNSVITQRDTKKKEKNNQDNLESTSVSHNSFMRNRRKNKIQDNKKSATIVKIQSSIKKRKTKQAQKIPILTNNDVPFQFKIQSSRMKTKKLERIPVIKNSDGMFKCEKCSKIFSCRRYLKKHHLTHFPIPEDQKPFKCPKCCRSFARERNLKKHSCIINDPDSEETYACEECGKTFHRRINLRKHRRTHSDKMNHTCTECGKGFIRKSDYTSHCLTHSDKKPFVCDVCKKSFTRKSHLVGHCLTHAAEKPFVCGVCNKRFLLERYLNDHAFIHTDQKPFVCDKCNKGFARRSQFNEHYVTHSDIKPFNCDECGAGFGLKRLLLTHQLSHMKEKPFSCDLCEKRFTRKGNLTSHQLLHLKERPFSCNICEKRFSRKSNLNSHQLLHLGSGYGKQKKAPRCSSFDYNYDSINMSAKRTLDSSLSVRCSRGNEITDSSEDDSYICDVMKHPTEVYFSLNPFFAKKDVPDVSPSTNS